MKRLVMFSLLAVMTLQGVSPALAWRRVVVRSGPRRTVVVVQRGWPLRRPLRQVVIYPARVMVRVVPAFYLAPVVWTRVVVVASPPRDVLVWEDRQTLIRDEDWSEFTLNCGTRGTRLWLEVASGKAQFDWAEIVFNNGETRVVDMNERVCGRGSYPLLDFRDGRMVDHVRVVARAKSHETRVVLRMEK